MEWDYIENGDPPTCANCTLEDTCDECWKKYLEKLKGAPACAHKNEVPE